MMSSCLLSAFVRSSIADSIKPSRRPIDHSDLSGSVRLIPSLLRPEASLPRPRRRCHGLSLKDAGYFARGQTQCDYYMPTGAMWPDAKFRLCNPAFFDAMAHAPIQLARLSGI